jgi:hypothetical protein
LDSTGWVGFVVATWQLSPVITRSESLLGSEQTETQPIHAERETVQASPGQLFGSGLRAGLLTFGGAYTAIPFLKDDAVERGR